MLEVIGIEPIGALVGSLLRQTSYPLKCERRRSKLAAFALRQ
jgi:hypothetical protein